MHAVVKDVESERARDDSIGNCGREDRMREPRKGRLEDEEKDRGHDKSETVHGEVMMDAVHQEVEGKERGRVGKVEVNMEEEPVEGIFQERPDNVAKEEASSRLREGGQREGQEVCEGEAGLTPEGRKGPRELEHGAKEEVRGDGAPEHRYDIPRRPGEDLQNVRPK